MSTIIEHELSLWPWYGVFKQINVVKGVVHTREGKYQIHAKEDQ